MADDDRRIDADTGADDKRSGGLKERLSGQNRDGPPRYFREDRDGELREVTAEQIAGKRIGKLTAQGHEKDLAISSLQQSQERMRRLLAASTANADQLYEDSLKKDLDGGKSDIERLRGELRAAINDGDVDKQADLQVKISEATTRVARAQVESENFAREKERRKPPNGERAADPGDGRDPALDRPEPKVSQRVKDWVKENPWFDPKSDEFDQARYDAALAINADILAKGAQPESDEYFEQLDARLKKAFAALEGDKDPDDTDTDDRRAGDRSGQDDDRKPNGSEAFAAPTRRGNGGDPPPGGNSLRRLTAEERAMARSLYPDKKYAEQMYALGQMLQDGRISEEHYHEKYADYDQAGRAAR